MSGGAPDMPEDRLDAERVRREHLAAVDERRHWFYLTGVLVGGTALMVLLIGVLAGAS